MSHVTEALLPHSEPKEEPRPILWGYALLAAVFWGTSNFFFSLVTTQDFATVCQSWTGFLLMSVVYRSLEIYRDSEPRNSDRIK
jgi:hypothetical protein